MKEERNKKLDKIRKEVEKLPEIELVRFRKANNYIPVIGEGSSNAKLFFIGEAPGEKEGITGKPFCGRSGKVLDELLQSVGIKREAVYITSVVKDRPPKNRDPKPEEIEIYAPFLDRQIEIIKPKILVTLGRFGMEYAMKRYGLEKELDSISAIHGKVFDTKMSWGGKVKIVPLYHPAASIYNQKLKGIVKEDFKILKDLAK